MNQNLEKLYQISHKKSKLILGLMSGTSLDGLDLALCEITGFGKSTKLNLKFFKTVEYSTELKNQISKVFAKGLVELPFLSALNAELGRIHGEMINKTLKEWKVENNSIDLIASHGQTIMHVPKNNFGMGSSTFQIGEADIISKETGIITVSDFRQKHIAHGGEGAPLVVFGDYLLFSNPNKDQILLNIGGIGNFTFLPRSENTNEIKLSDTGPGNTLIDAGMRYFYQKDFDQDGLIARSGKMIPELWESLINHPFLKREYPKSTGPEEFDFQFIIQNFSEFESQDIIRTLTEYSVYCIEKSFKDLINLDNCLNTEILISGGGANNLFLIELLQNKFPNLSVGKMKKEMIHPEAKEAALFAVLCNETISNPESSKQRRLGPHPWPYFGKISFPD